MRRHLNPILRPYVYGLFLVGIIILAICLLNKCSLDSEYEMIQRAENTVIHYQYNYSRTFRDMNDKQLEAAQKYGIRPLSSRDDTPSRRVCKIKSCEWYQLDPMTHSIPVLVPKAKKLLERIGSDFADSLERFDISGFCPIVTSVTRTEEDVHKLRRSGNVNASANSCHRYATTFDLAFTRFYKQSGREHAIVRSAMMKQKLAEVLKNIKDEGYCFVKYEYKQACFHVTVTEPND